MKLLASPLFNLLINNLFWVGCVVGRQQTIWIVAPAIIAYILMLLLSGTVKIQQILLPAAFGMAVDTLLTVSGVFVFSPGPLILPLWLCALWLAFATTLPLSLRVLSRHPVLAAVAGAVGFPLSYLAGFKLGAVGFGLPLSVVMILLIFIWALLLPPMTQWAQSTRRLINGTP